MNTEFNLEFTPEEIREIEKKSEALLKKADEVIRRSKKIIRQINEASK